MKTFFYYLDINCFVHILYATSLVQYVCKRKKTIRDSPLVEDPALGNSTPRQNTSI